MDVLCAKYSEPQPEKAGDFESLVHMCEFRAKVDGDKTAFVYLKDGETPTGHLSYSELAARGKAIAMQLPGDAYGERALLLYSSGLEFITAFVGCLYAGVLAVPVYTPQARQEHWARLDIIAKDAEAKYIFTTEDIAKTNQEFIEASEVLGQAHLVKTDKIETLAHQSWSAGDGSRLPDLESLAFLQYTSGSTGDPKGVMVSHGNLLHNQMLMHSCFGNQKDSVFVSWLPLFHDMGLIGNILHTIYLGATCYVMSPVAFIQKPVRWLQALSDYKGTTSFAPNFAYELCLKRVDEQQRDQLDLSNWDFALNGAEPVASDTIRRFTEYFAKAGLPQNACYPAYGLAEGTLVVSGGVRAEMPVMDVFDEEALTARQAMAVAPGKGRELVSSGKVWCDEVLRIVEPQSRTVCAEGGIGEIWVQSPSVCKGYWKNAKATDEVFNAYTSDTNEGPFLRTGDLGFVQADELYVAGRAKEVVIIRGRNHYPQDIEKTLQAVWPGFKKGGGAAFSFAKDNEEHLVIVQEVERTFLKKLDIDSVLEKVRQAISEWHELNLYELVLIRPATLPKTSSGKIQRTKAKMLYENGELAVLGDKYTGKTGNKAAAQAESAKAVEMPADFMVIGIANTLCAMVAQLTGLPMTQTVPTASPMSLGMDSLKCSELIGLVEQTWQVSLKLADVQKSEHFYQLAETVKVLQQGGAQAASGGQSASVADARPEKFELTVNQQSLLHLHQRFVDANAYNLCLPVWFDSPLNNHHMFEAARHLIRGHDALHMQLVNEGDDWMQQRVDYDTRQYNHFEQFDGGHQAFLDSRANRRFDVEKGPLFFVETLKVGERTLLVLSAHHIIGDLWTMLNSVRELLSHYQAATKGKLEEKTSNDSHFYDYVVDEDNYIHSDGFSIDKRFWKNTLQGVEPVLNMPGVKRGKEQTFNGAAVDFTIDAELAAKAEQYARNNKVTLFGVLFSAYCALLHRYTNQQDIIVGTPFSHRQAAKYRHLAGYLVTTLPIVSHLGSEDFDTLVRNNTQQLLQASEHARLPFAEMLNLLDGVVTEGMPPLVQALFNYHVAHGNGVDAALIQGQSGESLTVEGLSVSPCRVEQKWSQFDLTLSVVPLSGGGLEGRLNYNSDLFDAPMMAAFCESYRRMLQLVLSRHDDCVVDLPLLSPSGQNQQLVDWNDTTVDWQDVRTITDCIHQSAVTTPDAIALIYKGQSMSYEVFDQTTAKLAGQLCKMDIGQEDVVGVKMQRSNDLVLALVAIMRTGAAYVPIDPALPHDRIVKMLAIARPKLVLTDLCEATAGEQNVVTLDFTTLNNTPAPENVELPRIHPKSAAYILFTSGSTGEPKAVVNTHEAINNRLRWQHKQLPVSTNDRVLLKTPFNFDVSVWEFFWPLMYGATLVVAEHDGHKDTRYLAELIAEQRVNLMHFVPSMLSAFLAEDLSNLSQVKNVVCSGEALGKDVQKQFYAKLPSATLTNLYGPTEAAIDVTCWTCRIDHQGATVPIGYPISNIRLYILNESYQMQPKGVAGELFIGGVGLARGYCNRPGLTAQTFVPDPFGNGERLYHTGDLARFVDDGCIEFLGRKDHQIKLRGQRIEMGEIEQVAKNSRYISEALVVVANPLQGGELVMFGVTKGGVSDTMVNELHNFMVNALPSYMVPNRLIMLDALPLNPNGKVDRKKLVSMAQTTSVDDGEGSNNRAVGRTTPNSSTEASLLFLISQLLDNPQIEFDKSFFELGGHSLLATRLATSIRQFFHIDFAVSQVYSAANLQDMAANIEQQAGVATPPGVDWLTFNDSGSLNVAQQSIWLNDVMDDNQSKYLMPLVLEFSQLTDADALANQVERVLNAHPQLTCLISQVEYAPMRSRQPLDNENRVDWLTMVDADEKTIEDFIDKLIRDPLDIAGVGPVRATLIERGQGRFTLVLVIHHIVADGISLETLVSQILSGEEVPLVSKNAYHAGFCAWQAENLGNGNWQPQLDYWLDNLAGAPRLLDLPADHPRPARQSGNGAMVCLALDCQMREQLQDKAKALGVSPFVMMMAAYQLLFYKYGRERDVVIGTPVSNRPMDFPDEVVGLCVNTLALRCEVNPFATPSEFIRATAKQFLSGLENKDVPFETVLEALQLPPASGYMPLVQAMIAQQPDIDAAIGDVSGVSWHMRHNGSAKYDLNLMVANIGDGITLHLEYSEDLFVHSTAQNILSQYAHLLEQLIFDERETVAELSLAPRVEVKAKTQTAKLALGEQQLVARYYAALGQVDGDKVAMSLENKTMSYNELETRSSAMADHLIKFGVEKGQFVGLHYERGFDFVVAMLAVLKAGCAYVPLDPDYPDERLAYICQDAGLACVLGDGDAPGWLEQGAYLSPKIRGSKKTKWRKTCANAVAYMIYTSGSTGKPKGVMVSHSNVCRLFDAANGFEFNEKDVWTLFHSTAFDFSVWEIWGALLHGGELVIVPYWLSREPQDFARLLLDKKVTVLNQTPSAFNQLQEVVCVKGAKQLKALRYIIFGGEALAMRTLSRWYAHQGNNTTLVNMYGITETTVHVTHCTITEQMVKEDISVIGEPLADLELYVLDERLRPQADGVPGELYVTGAGVSLGYFGKAGLTAERFIPDPFTTKPGALMYRTGDLAKRLSSGALQYLGRIDHQVQVRGFRIELGEIEAVLSEVLDVDQVYVQVDDAEQYLLAYLFDSAKTPVTVEDAKAQVAGRLPAHMMPGFWAVLDAMPLTNNGKLDRSKLPTPQNLHDSVEVVALQSDTERQLAQCWCDVLDINEVGRNHNFFDIGGNSLSAIVVLGAVKLQLKVDLSVRAIFDYPVLHTLAARIDEIQGNETQSQAQTSTNVQQIVPVGVSQRVLASMAQQRLWMLDDLSGNPVLYTMPMAFDLTGKLDTRRLANAIKALVKRHRILVSCFAKEGDELYIDESPTAQFEVVVHDLTNLDESSARTKAREYQLANEKYGFELCNEPLTRAEIVCVSESQHLLLLNFHHGVFDGWSFNLFADELSHLFNTGEYLPMASCSYRDVVAFEHQYPDRHLDALSYFVNSLQGAELVLELPSDRPRPVQPSYRGALHGFELSQVQSDAVKAFCAKGKYSVSQLCLSAFALLLQRYSQKSDVVVGIPVANRAHPQTQDVIGFFANTLALRVKTDAKTTVDGLLGNVRQDLLSAFDHQQLGFELLVEALKVERSLSVSPIFQTLFVMQNAQAGRIELRGLQAQYAPALERPAKYELSLYVREQDIISGEFEYATDLFDEKTLALMSVHYVHLLLALTETPGDKPLDAIPTLVAPQIDRLQDHQGAEVTIEGATIDGEISKIAAASPHLVALRDHNGEMRYQALEDRAQSLANQLQIRGVKSGDRVGLCMGRSNDLVVAMLAIFKVGGAYVPLDPAYPADRLGLILEDAEPSVIIHDEAGRLALPQITKANSVLLDIAQVNWHFSQPLRSVVVHPEQIAYLIYTSGSTGKPKGVCITHNNVLALIAWARSVYSEDQLRCVLAATSMCFDLSVFEMFVPLSIGGTVVVAPDALALPDFARHNITLLNTVPSAAEELIRAKAIADTVSVINLAGEPLSRDLVNRLYEDSNAQHVYNLYGPSEDTTYSTGMRIAAAENTKPLIGKPIANTRAYILDSAMNLVPDGVKGELYLGGNGVSNGYLNKPGMTAEKYLPNPFDGQFGSRLYRTGDLVIRREDGNIEFIGRADHQVKVRGFRVELSDIEYHLNRLEQVDAAVVLLSNQFTPARLVAYVAAGGASALNIKSKLAEVLPNHMVPDIIICLDQLPLMPNGKVDRKTLTAREVELTDYSQDKALSTETEQRLAELWSDALGLQVTSGAANFFDLGGYSLMATRLSARVFEHFGVEFGLKKVFEYSRLDQMAQYIDTQLWFSNENDIDDDESLCEEGEL